VWAVHSRTSSLSMTPVYSHTKVPALMGSRERTPQPRPTVLNTCGGEAGWMQGEG
jgi:hypothetical protein